jgi:carbon monoxide dehydrogenase subunit G
MQISTRFEIEAPFDEVWDILLDLDRVAPCVPGAEIEERIDESTARGRFRLRLGPVTASYRGTISIDEIDRERGEVVLRGLATDTSAGGTAEMVVHNHVVGENGTTSVRMDTDLKLTGRAAQFGGRRSMMQSIADRMVGQFAAALREELSTPGSTGRAQPEHVGGAAAREPPAPEPEPLDAGPLLRGLVADHVPIVAGGCLLAGFVAGLLAGRAVGSRQ